MTSEAPSAVRTLAHAIGGELVAPVGGEYFDDFDPATAERIAQVPRGDGRDVHAAVSAARDAARTWVHTSTEARARLLDAVADGLEARLDELADLESRDTGKPLALARAVDIPRAVANFRFFAGAVRQDHTAMHPMDEAINYTLRRPLGVVGLITPWNLPLYLLTWKAAPALAMGNAVVAKPSELTPLTAQVLAEVVREAAEALGAPPGVFNLVHGLGPEAGQALVEHSDVAAISFTGGTATGAKVAATAAPMFKKLSLELGGKNPTIVFADCDLEPTLDGAVRAGFLNQGQVCLCGSRILVEKPLYERFVAGLAERVGAMKVGDPRDPETKLGALISAAHREKVEGYVALAREEGGEVLTGGGRPALDPPFDQGAFLEPAVVAGLPPTCRTSQEEVFGPLVTVHPFESEAEAVAIANGVRYGLAASVWTRE